MSEQCHDCYSYNVVPDYGYKFNTGKLPETMPYTCLDCGQNWGGIADELPVMDKETKIGCAIGAVSIVVFWFIVLIIFMNGR